MRKIFNLIRNVYKASSESKYAELASILRKGMFYGELSFAVQDGLFRLTTKNGSYQAYWDLNDSGLSVLFFDSRSMVTNGYIEDFCDQFLTVIKDTEVLANR